MRILIATGLYPPSIGGPATYSKLLFDELPKRGFPVTVVSFDEVRGLPKVVCHIVYLWKVFCRALKSDVVYAQDPVSVGLPALVAAKILRKRFFLKVVGDYAWEQGVQRFGVGDSLDEFSRHRRDQGYHFFVRLLMGVESFVARGAERIIVPSKYLKLIVSSWNVPKEKIEVVYNSFELPPERPYREHIQVSGKVLVSAGRLVPWKGFPVLIDAVGELTKKLPDIKLFIIGDGPDRKMLERRVKSLGLERNIFLVGAVDKETLFAYIRAAHVFVLNTGYEGFSHQLLEVLSLGVPVITTDVGGNPEIIKSRENGLLVPYNDSAALGRAIESLLLDEEKSRELGLRGKETVDKFTNEKTVEGLISVLNKE